MSFSPRRAREVFNPLQHEVKTLTSKNVLCIEAQAEIQYRFRKNLTRMGYRVLLVADAERAAERYRESPTDAVIFDADGLGTETVEVLSDMLEKAQEEGKPSSPSSCSVPARRRSRKTAVRRPDPSAGQAHQAETGPGRDQRLFPWTEAWSVRLARGIALYCRAPATLALLPTALMAAEPRNQEPERDTGVSCCRGSAVWRRTIASLAITTVMPRRVLLRRPVPGLPVPPAV